MRVFKCIFIMHRHLYLFIQLRQTHIFLCLSRCSAHTDLVWCEFRSSKELSVMVCLLVDHQAVKASTITKDWIKTLYSRLLNQFVFVFVFLFVFAGRLTTRCKSNNYHKGLVQECTFYLYLYCLPGQSINCDEDLN